MKYYGFIYEGNVDKYATNSEEYFDSPYKALFDANRKWEHSPDLQIPRLLLVIKREGTDNLYAYFQFTNFSACQEFISNQKEIHWSDPSNQIWNGNAIMMT